MAYGGGPPMGGHGGSDPDGGGLGGSGRSSGGSSGWMSGSMGSTPPKKKGPSLLPWATVLVLVVTLWLLLK